MRRLARGFLKLVIGVAVTVAVLAGALDYAFHRVYPLRPHMTAAVSARIQAEHIHPLTYDQIPALYREAVVSTEDRRFAWDPGFDPIGLARSILVDVEQDGVGGRAAGWGIRGGEQSEQPAGKGHTARTPFPRERPRDGVATTPHPGWTSSGSRAPGRGAAQTVGWASGGEEGRWTVGSADSRSGAPPGGTGRTVSAAADLFAERSGCEAR